MLCIVELQTMFDVYFVTYKNYSIDIIDNYAVISKKNMVRPLPTNC